MVGPGKIVRKNVVAMNVVVGIQVRDGTMVGNVAIGNDGGGSGLQPAGRFMASQCREFRRGNMTTKNGVLVGNELTLYRCFAISSPTTDSWKFSHGVVETQGAPVEEPTDARRVRFRRVRFRCSRSRRKRAAAIASAPVHHR